eukprot:NODE_920_length_1823_cov_23.652762_g810_i0.p1 GENE.NODE_920_length_1823_cov_23.652762_g810_i0~~NODE_920_length_1823_cov_23.652762_g810_i0.p1  ORF type:complete len:359 (-),score=47.72 NODE_920_length_1823_cov_23.652762_g810_i0:25-1101(-)
MKRLPTRNHSSGSILAAFSRRQRDTWSFSMTPVRRFFYFPSYGCRLPRDPDTDCELKAMMQVLLEIHTIFFREYRKETEDTKLSGGNQFIQKRFLASASGLKRRVLCKAAGGPAVLAAQATESDVSATEATRAGGVTSVAEAVGEAAVTATANATAAAAAAAAAAVAAAAVVVLLTLDQLAAEVPNIDPPLGGSADVAQPGCSSLPHPITTVAIIRFLKEQVLAGCCLVFTGFSSPRCMEWPIAMEHGAQCTDWNKKVTHVVFRDGGHVTTKTSKGLGANVYVVSVQWFADSIARLRRQDESAYLHPLASLPQREEAGNEESSSECSDDDLLETLDDVWQDAEDEREHNALSSNSADG